MLPPEKVREIQGLLTQGALSQRAISRATGASRATIAAIAAGTRPDYESRRRPLAFEPPVGPIARCPTCGGKVRTPCLACQIRRLRRTAELAAKAPRRADGQPIRLAQNDRSRASSVA